jgi:hypothetical protein
VLVLAVQYVHVEKILRKVDLIYLEILECGVGERWEITAGLVV